MRILVTGGTGFVGSHIILDLLLSGVTDELCVIDNLSNSYSDCLSAISAFTNKELDFRELDLRDFESLNFELSRFKPDVVIHCAGLKSVEESSFNPMIYYDNNVVGSVNLLKSMDNIGCKNIIFSSSATVYGNPAYLPFDENHETKPINPYGLTKLIVENILKDWCRGEGKSSVSLRYFNPAGCHKSRIINERSKNKPNNLFPVIIDLLKRDEGYLEIYGMDYDTSDGTGVRDYTHIMDVSEAHIKAINYSKKINSFTAINIGMGEGTSVLEVVKNFENLSGRKIKIKSMPRRKGDIAAFWSDCRQANLLLGWTCKYDLTDMCSDALSWNIE